MNYDSPAALSALLRQRGLSMKKRFGQNFLVNREIRERIIAALDVQEDELVWEIGPGIGSLSHRLLQLARRCVFFEIDHGFIALLKEEFASLPSWRIVEGDFLKTWPSVWQEEIPAAIIGNLPYSRGSAMIGTLLENEALPQRMVFTLQKEVVARMAARPGSSDYSSFSLLCQYCCQVEALGDIGRNAFYPKPEVISAYVRFTPRRRTRTAPSPRQFSLLARALFASRRKKILNNLLTSGLPGCQDKDQLAAQIESAGLSPHIRGEKLSVEEVSVLAEILFASH